MHEGGGMSEAKDLLNLVEREDDEEEIVTIFLGGDAMHNLNKKSIEFSGSGFDEWSADVEMKVFKSFLNRNNLSVEDGNLIDKIGKEMGRVE